MIPRALLKDVLTESIDYARRRSGSVQPREGIRLPRGLRKAVILHGVRRSGKTYAMLDLFRSRQANAVYLDFEDERLRLFSADDFAPMLDAFFDLRPDLSGRRLALFLDEVQNVEGWERFARRAVEKESHEVFAAGSSSRITPKRIHTSLRGREWSIEVGPFSFREFLRARGVKTLRLHGVSRAPLRAHFANYLRWGGFPEAVLAESDLDRRTILREYLDAMFFKDLVEQHGLTNIPLLDTLADHLFGAFAAPFSVASFHRKNNERIPGSRERATEYFEAFRASLLVHQVELFSDSVHRRRRNPVKIYLADTGLARRVRNEDAGRLLENAVFLELRRDGAPIHFFQDDQECDFVVRGESGFSAWQVCHELTDSNRPREFRGLIACCRALGISSGTILTFDQAGEETVEGIDVLIRPAWRWMIERAKSALFADSL